MRGACHAGDSLTPRLHRLVCRGTRPVVMVDDAEGCDPAALSDLGRTWVEAPGATRPTLLLGARTSSRALAHALDDDVR